MSRRDYTAFVLLILLLAAFSVFDHVQRREQAEQLRPSSYLTGPGGTGALFQVMDELRMKPMRGLTPFLHPDSLRSPLALLAPSEPPTPMELHTLAEWIRAGGVLIYAARPGDPTLDTLGLQLGWIGADSVARPGTRRIGSSAVPIADPLTAGVDGARPFIAGFEVADSGRSIVPLLETEAGEVVALEMAMGDGRVIAFSDVRPLTNRFVRSDAGAATIFARATAEAGAGVSFDEYHHGFRTDGSVAGATLQFLSGTPLGLAIVQVGIAGLGLLLLAGARFGSPMPPPSARRRDPLEHVDALAGAYRRAGAHRTARNLLLDGLLRRMGESGRGDRREQALDTVARALPPGRRAVVDRLRDEWRKGDSGDLVVLAREMDRIFSEGRTD
jgi:hypothetical protein